MPEKNKFFYQFIKNYGESISSLFETVPKDDLEELAAEIIRVRETKSKIALLGNGGSAAIANHMAVDFTKTCDVAAMTFNETSLITCFSNDYGYENWMKIAINNYVAVDDLVIIISSSGQSENVLRAARTCNDLGVRLVTFSGFKEDNPLRSAGTINFWVDSCIYNHVEMVHHLWLVAVNDYLAGIGKPWTP